MMFNSNPLMLGQQSIRVSSEFSPFDIAGLELWYDQSDLSTLWQDSARTSQVTTAGQSVGAWDDKSGNSRHALQGTSANQPTYQSGNISFDGGDWLDASYGLASTPITMFVVCANPTNNGDYSIASAKSDTDANHFGILYRHTVNKYSYTSRLGTNYLCDATVTSNGSATHVVCAVGASATDRKIYVDGSGPGTNTSSSAPHTQDTFTIGRVSDSTPSNYWIGTINEVIVYASALNDTNRQTVENYLAAKWGIS